MLKIFSLKPLKNLFFPLKKHGGKAKNIFDILIVLINFLYNSLFKLFFNVNDKKKKIFCIYQVNYRLFISAIITCKRYRVIFIQYYSISDFILMDKWSWIRFFKESINNFLITHKKIEFFSPFLSSRYLRLPEPLIKEKKYSVYFFFIILNEKTIEIITN